MKKGEGIGQRTHMRDTLTPMTVWWWPEGGGWALGGGGQGMEGGDICNSVHKNKVKKINEFFQFDVLSNT